MTPSAHVIWHDIECGGYTADLALWLELARAADGPVLDVGAGTGRVAIPLARAGHDVTALDLDDELLAELGRRAADAGLEIELVVADASAFAAERRYALVAMPMQTLQLLPGAVGRAGFFASAARALAPGGLVAAAIAEHLEPFDAAVFLPDPDRGEADGRRYISQPVAVRPDGPVVRIERVRETVGPDGERTREDDVVTLAEVDAGEIAHEAAAWGLHAEAPREIAATDEHVGSTVVMLRG
jgi:SAM-dependent methyltransferase